MTTTAVGLRDGNVTPIPIDMILNSSTYMQVAEVIMATIAVCLVSPISITFFGGRRTKEGVIPVSLQSLIVLLIPSLLGSKRGIVTIILYLFCGAILELPVFANGSAGRDKLIGGPTGGFLWAFPVAAYYMGTVLEKRQCSFQEWILHFLIGHLLILTIGFTWLFLVLDHPPPRRRSVRSILSFFIQDMVRPLIPGLVLKTLVGATLADLCNLAMIQLVETTTTTTTTNISRMKE
eukprot:scaffold1169_cov120-Cylindrotheca_fusiformis.AAC.1